MESINISHPTVLTLSLPSCTILALDSRVCKQFNGQVVSNQYDKLIQLRPCVFLACFGDSHLIDQVRDALLLADLPNHRFIGEIAHFVQNTVNTVLENSRNEDGGEINNNRTLEIVLVGQCELDNRCYVYNISKGPDTWMCFARREVVGRVATTGSINALGTFLEENILDENMTEEEAVDYALRCMKYAVEFSWYSGGRIQVVAMKPGSSIVHAWEQNDPTRCINEYLYQEPRMSEGY